MYTLNNPYKVRSYTHFRDNHVINGQDYDIMDLLRRFSRGERLNVDQRPLNVLNDGDRDETFDNILPQVDDIVELEQLDKDLKDRKQQILDRRKADVKQKPKQDKNSVEE